MNMKKKQAQDERFHKRNSLFKTNNEIEKLEGLIGINETMIGIRYILDGVRSVVLNMNKLSEQERSKVLSQIRKTILNVRDTVSEIHNLGKDAGVTLQELNRTLHLVDSTLSKNFPFEHYHFSLN